MVQYNKAIAPWISGMQKTFALSTAEVVYYTASEVAVEIIYPRNLLHNMSIPQADDPPTYVDNTSCIEWESHILCWLERAKHINFSKHFAHHVIQIQLIRFICVSADGQLADIFTQVLPVMHFERCGIGLAGEKMAPRDLENLKGGKTNA
jgi:hypothetical protein